LNILGLGYYFVKIAKKTPMRPAVTGLTYENQQEG
jgi:hypothetical protein